MEPSEKVKYVTDDDGNKSIVLPAETYQEMLEDIQDLVAIAERKDEESITFDELKNSLKSDGLI